ncbi:hypothetical protein VTK26DRAFT_2833 [Humicola hyalothermophila]
MNLLPGKRAPRRRDGRVILHFDLDCFYAQCVENRQPSLRTQPLGVKQKGILATCNYVARRHGVRKLMPIAEAKKICPSLVLADGEDLSPFRDVSKRLYALLRSYSWNGKIQRLGLDEVFLDVTDMVAYNVELLNANALRQSFFCLSRSDPEVGFAYDATSFEGCVVGVDDGAPADDPLRMRLLVASHLAQYLRLRIEEEGYTSACGISTNKLLAKLAGDKNKPRNQTTLFAPRDEDVLAFVDAHKLRKIPGIGPRTARVLESFVLGRDLDPNVYTTECLTTAGQVRTHPGISAPSLERLLSAPGLERGLGRKVWALLHGVDDTDVKPAADVPTQISIEDSYKGGGLRELPEIRAALLAVSASLLRRMRVDLLDREGLSPPEEDHPHSSSSSSSSSSRKWLAYPRTIRLTTRPYVSFADNKPYNWGRASRSGPLPSFVFGQGVAVEKIAERLVDETLLPLFHRLNPVAEGRGAAESGGSSSSSSSTAGWNVGLINVCVTNMTGTDGGAASGRDIAVMFRRQEDVLREFTVWEHAGGGGAQQQRQELQKEEKEQDEGEGNDDAEAQDDDDNDDDDHDDDLDMWDDDDGPDKDSDPCPICGRRIPLFARVAHERYHSVEEDL